MRKVVFITGASSGFGDELLLKYTFKNRISKGEGYGHEKADIN